MCNCCCCSQTTTINLQVIQAPQNENQIPEPQLPNTPPVVEPLDSWKCGTSHALVFVIRQIVELTIDWEGDYDQWREAIESLFSWAGQGFTNLLYGVYVTLVSWLSSVTGASQAYGVFQSIEDALVCAIYTANSEDAAYQAVKAIINQAFSYSTLWRLVFLLIASIIPYSLAFTNGNPSQLPPQFRNRTCDCEPESGGESWPSEPESGYEWRLSDNLALTANTYTTTGTIAADMIEANFNITVSGATWNPNMELTKPTVAQGESIVGFTYLVKESINDNQGGIVPDGLVRVNGREDNAPFRLLWVTTADRAIAEATAVFDLVTEQAQVAVATDKVIGLYSKSSTGGSVPKAGHVLIQSILWLVKLP